MAKNLTRKLFQQFLSSMVTKNFNCSSMSTVTDSVSSTPSTSSSSAAKCPFSRQTYSMTRCPVISETKAAIMTESVPKTDLLPYEAIPTPKGLPLIGTLFDLIKSGGAQYVHQYCDRRHQELGPIYRETMGNVEGVFIADAALMQKVCFMKDLQNS
jgi:ecdysteroid 2-hydroxylase